ncbi:MAG: hypothetical protein QW372_00130 [Nitrososphaerales archaeon]
MSRMVIVGIIIAILFVFIGTFWLYESTETFDKIAELFGAEEQSIYQAPFPDYEIPGFEGNKIVNIAIGITSTLLILGVTFIVGKALRVRKVKR